MASNDWSTALCSDKAFSPRAEWREEESPQPVCVRARVCVLVSASVCPYAWECGCVCARTARLFVCPCLQCVCGCVRVCASHICVKNLECLWTSWAPSDVCYQGWADSAAAPQCYEAQPSNTVIKHRDQLLPGLSSPHTHIHTHTQQHTSSSQICLAWMGVNSKEVTLKSYMWPCMPIPEICKGELMRWRLRD